MTRPRIPGIETLAEDAKALNDVLNKESDLACVLIGASYLDVLLASLLERHFIKGRTSLKLLSPLHGPLGTMHNRAALCYCLGLISKGMYQNLTKVGEIRNKFAHRHLLLDFSDSEIVSLTDSLKFPTVDSKIVDDKGEQHDDPEPFARLAHPRNRFNIITVLMANRLLIIGLETKRGAKRQDEWS